MRRIVPLCILFAAMIFCLSACNDESNGTPKISAEQFQERLKITVEQSQQVARIYEEQMVQAEQMMKEVREGGRQSMQDMKSKMESIKKSRNPG